MGDLRPESICYDGARNVKWGLVTELTDLNPNPFSSAWQRRTKTPLGASSDLATKAFRLVVCDGPSG